MNSTILTYFFKAVISVLFLFFALFHKKSKLISPLGKTLLVLNALLPWASAILRFFLTDRLALTVLLFPCLLLFSLGFFLCTTRRTPLILRLATAVPALLILFQRESLCCAADAPNSIHFWRISLLLALTVTALMLMLLLTNRLKLVDNRLSERIAFLFVVLLLSFVLVWSSVSILNYALDHSEPVSIDAVVTGKAIKTTRYIASHEVTATTGEQSLTFDISSSDYQALQTGSEITLFLYQGAFGDPYYVLGGD